MVQLYLCIVLVGSLFTLIVLDGLDFPYDIYSFTVHFMFNSLQIWP